MMRAWLFAVLLVPAAGAAAQDRVSSSGPVVAITAADEQARVPARRRRRPAMAVYIEQASLQSQLRVRFDLGFGNNIPDRAEFFYAKCGCYQFDPPPNGDLDAPGPGPGVPTELDFRQFYVLGEFMANTRVSLFAELPVRTIVPQGFLEFGSPYNPFPNQSGIGDVRFGTKLSLFSNDAADVTLQLRASAPTGDPAKGAGSNTWTIEPALLMRRDVGNRVGLEAQFGVWHPFEGSNGVPTDSPDDFSGDVLFYGFGPSFNLVANDRVRFSPVVELVGWHVLNGSETNCTVAACTFDAKGTNIVNLKVGAQTTVSEVNSFAVSYGWALTDDHWYERIFRVEYRRRF